jgi:hypothetical protein
MVNASRGNLLWASTLSKAPAFATGGGAAEGAGRSSSSKTARLSTNCPVKFIVVVPRAGEGWVVCMARSIHGVGGSPSSLARCRQKVDTHHPAMKSGQTATPLDKLLAHAEQFAASVLREVGLVPYAMLVRCPTGGFCFMPQETGGQQGKDNFAKTARLICIGHDASAVVMILPARMKLAAPGKTPEPKERPSGPLDLREVLVLVGEMRGAKRQKYLPVLRTAAGGFLGFGDADLPEFDNSQVRFAEILPAHPPPKHMQHKARLVLEAMGVTEDYLMQGGARWS